MKRAFVLASCGEAEVPSMPETGLEPARAWLAHQPLKLARLPILPLWDGEESPRWRHSDHASGNLGKSRQSRFEASPPSVLYRKPEVQKFRGHQTQFPASVPMNYVWCPRNLSTKVYQLGFNRTLGLTQKDIASFVGCSQSL